MTSPGRNVGKASIRIEADTSGLLASITKASAKAFKQFERDASKSVRRVQRDLDGVDTKRATRSVENLAKAIGGVVTATGRLKDANGRFISIANAVQRANRELDSTANKLDLIAKRTDSVNDTFARHVKVLGSTRSAYNALDAAVREVSTHALAAQQAASRIGSGIDQRGLQRASTSARDIADHLERADRASARLGRGGFDRSGVQGFRDDVVRLNVDLDNGQSSVATFGDIADAAMTGLSMATGVASMALSGMQSAFTAVMGIAGQASGAINSMGAALTGAGDSADSTNSSLDHTSQSINNVGSSTNGTNGALNQLHISFSNVGGSANSSSQSFDSVTLSLTNMGSSANSANNDMNLLHGSLGNSNSSAHDTHRSFNSLHIVFGAVGGSAHGAGSAIGSVGSAAGGASPSVANLAKGFVTAELAMGAFKAVALVVAFNALTPLIATVLQATTVLLVIPAVIGAVIASMSVLKVATSGVGEAFSALQKSQESGIDTSKAVAAAQKGVVAAERGVEQAHRAVEDAARGVEQAERRVGDAEEALVSAHQRAQRAQEDLTRARKDAADQIRDLNDELKDSALSEEAAILGVERARERLEKTKSDPGASDLDRREADLAYRQAVERLDEERESTSKLKEETAEANRKGVEGSDQVVSAKQAVVDANKAVADSERGVADAHQGVADAHRNLADAQRGVADAQLRVAEAMAAVNDAASNPALEAFNKAMAELSPAAQAFVYELDLLKERWDALKMSVQENFFLAMGDSLTQLADNKLPALQRGMEQVSTALGEGVKTFLGKIGEIQDSKIDYFFKNVSDAIGPASAALGDFAVALFNIISAGSGALPTIAVDLADAAASFREWTEKPENAEKIKKWILEGWESLKDIAGFVWEFVTVTLPKLGKWIDQHKDDFKTWKDDIDDVFNTLETIQDIAGVATSLVALPATAQSTDATKAGAVPGVSDSLINNVGDLFGFEDADTRLNTWTLETHEKLKTFFSELPGKVGEWFSGLGSSIGGFFSRMWDDHIWPFLSELPGKVGGFLAGLPGQLAEMAGTVAGTIARAIFDFSGYFTSGGFTEDVSGIWNDHIWPWISGVFDSVTNFVTQTIPNAWRRIRAYFTEGGFTTDIGDIWNDHIWPWVSGIFDSITNFVTETIPNFGRKIRAYFTEGGFTEDIGGVRDSIFNAGRDLIQGLLDGISDIWNGIGNWVQTNIFDRFMNAFDTAFDRHSPSQVMFDAGVDVVQGMIDGVGSMGTALWNFVKRFFKENVVDTVTFGVFDEHSPSRVFRQRGIWLGEGLAVGIDESKSLVVSAAKRLGEAALVDIPAPTLQVMDAAVSSAPPMPDVGGSTAAVTLGGSEPTGGGTPDEALEASAKAAEEVYAPAMQVASDATANLGNAMMTTVTGLIAPAQTAIQQSALLTGQTMQLVTDEVINPAMQRFGLQVDATNLQFQTAMSEGITPAFWGMSSELENTRLNSIDPTFEAIKSGVGLVGQSFSDAATNIGTSWDTLRASTGKPARFVVETVYNQGIMQAWNKVAKLVGADEMTEAPLGQLQQYATGGLVRGPGGPTEDKVPAMLSNREYVLNAATVSRIGVENLDYVNSGGRADGLLHLAAGGAVDAMLVKAHEFARSMDGQPYLMGGAAPGPTDCSGFMSAIADVILGGSGNGRWWYTGNFPYGQSDSVNAGGQNWLGGLSHGFSIGVDGGPDSAGANGHTAGTLSAAGSFPTVNVESGGSHGDVAYGGPAAGADAGFRTVWHLPISEGAFESGGGGGGSRVPLTTIVGEQWDEIMDPIREQAKAAAAEMKNVQVAVQSKSAETFNSTARDWVMAEAAKRDTASGGAVTGTGSGPVQEQVKQAMAQFGWDEGPQWNSVDWIVSKESGWNPTAQNPSSTAYGLFQFLDDTWATVNGTKTSDPYQQGVYGGRYMQQRYDTPQGAQAFWEANGWYDQGGVASGKGVMPKNTIEPERVLSPSQTEAFESFIGWLTKKNDFSMFAKELGEAIAEGQAAHTQSATAAGTQTGVTKALSSSAATSGALGAVTPGGVKDPAFRDMIDRMSVMDTSGLWGGRTVTVTAEEAAENRRERWEALWNQLFGGGHEGDPGKGSTSGASVDSPSGSRGSSAGGYSVDRQFNCEQITIQVDGSKDPEATGREINNRLLKLLDR